MMDGERSPAIISLRWGSMTVDGLGEGRDFKLWPGGGRPWDWNELGTGHIRGIQSGEVDELLAHGASVIILSKGLLSRLRVPGKTRAYIESRGCRVEVAATKNAVERYNRYAAEGVAVGGLFHSTC